MKRIFFLTVLLLPLLTVGQELITITGTVVDASNGSPLAFAQLTVSGTTLGTSANNDGEFLITIPAIHAKDTLLFGYLGYEPYSLPIPHLLNGTVKVRLRPIPIQLAEVEVVGFTPQEVIRRAVEAIPGNYGRDSLLITAFIRVQKIVNNRMAEYAEAVVQDLKDGYYLYPKKDQRRKHDRSNFPLLVKGRVRSDTGLVNSMGDVGRQAFCLSCPFVLDIAEMYHNTALDESMFGKYDYKMKETSDIEGRKVYHITYDQKDNVNDMLYRGDIYIRAAGFVIEKVIYKPSMKAYDTYEKTKYKRPFEIRNTPGWIMEMPMGQNIVTYAERDGRWTLATVRNDYAMVYVNTQTNKKVRYQYKTDLVVTEVQRDKAVLKSFKGDKSLGTDQRWDQLAGPADDGFWAKYNFLPVEDALKKSLKEMKD